MPKHSTQQHNDFFKDIYTIFEHLHELEVALHKSRLITAPVERLLDEIQTALSATLATSPAEAQSEVKRLNNAMERYVAAVMAVYESSALPAGDDVRSANINVRASITRLKNKLRALHAKLTIDDSWDTNVKITAIEIWNNSINLR